MQSSPPCQHLSHCSLCLERSSLGLFLSLLLHTVFSIQVPLPQKGLCSSPYPQSSFFLPQLYILYSGLTLPPWPCRSSFLNHCLTISYLHWLVCLSPLQSGPQMSPESSSLADAVLGSAYNPRN